MLTKSLQVVPESSAILGLPNELVVPINAHHRGMCRFSSSKDQNLILVQGLIKELSRDKRSLVASKIPDLTFRLFSLTWKGLYRSFRVSLKTGRKTKESVQQDEIVIVLPKR